MRDFELDEAQEPRSYNRPDLVRGAREAEADAAPIEWKPVVRRRLAVLAGVLVLWAVAIEVRLVVLQVVQHERWATELTDQLTHVVKVPATRGAILDRNGVALASSVDGDVVMVDPIAIKPAERPAVAALVCAQIERCSGESPSQILEALGRRNRGATAWRLASPADAKRIRALGRRDVWIAREPRRYYPNRELAAHVLGFVNAANAGGAGLEFSYEASLRGRDGTRLSYNDANQRAFDSTETGTVAGHTVELTIDRHIQHVAETALARRIAETRSSSGVVAVSDPYTGELLALALWPTFNPNTFSRVAPEALINRAVQEVYEPGSTMKFITAAAAIEFGLFSPDSVFNLGNGSIRLGSHVIDDEHAHASMTLRDVVAKSSNVGAVMVGLRVGERRFTEFVRRFGFGEALLRDFPGQSRGIVASPETVSETQGASMAMGYSVGVTALQMLGAINVIANGGTLVEPHVVRAVIAGDQRRAVAPRAVRRVVSARTAETVTSMLETVVETGTGKAAAVPGFTVAGKTGTARRVKQGSRGYSDSHTSSFIGFVPSRQPAISIIVVVDSPKTGGIYGGTIAAPVFAAVADETLRYLGATPTVETEKRPRTLVARRAAPAPGAPEMAAAPPAASRETTITTAAITPGIMPDLRGLSARTAVRLASRTGVSLRLQGDGVVTEQEIDAGRPVELGATCRVRLERQVRRRAVEGTEP